MTTIFLIFILIAIFTPVILIVINMTGKSATPSRVLKERIPTYTPPKVKEAFSLNVGIEEKSKKSLIIPQDTLTGHILMLAPTRRGKTTFIDSLLNQFMDSQKEERRPMIIFDAQKAETENIIAIAKAHGRHVTILPDEGYNPLRAGESPTRRAISYAEVFAQASGLGAGEAQFFLQFAQLFVQTILPLYEEVYNQPMILDELLDLLISDRARKTLLDKAKLSEAKYLYTSHFGNWTQSQIDKNLSGLILFIERMADKDIKHLYNVRNAPTIEELANKGEIIVIREGATKTNQYARARGLIFAIEMQKYISRREIGQRPVIPVILDEAHLYFNSGFEDYLATCGKYGVVNFIAFQDFSQAGEMERTIRGNCITKIILGGLGAEDAKIIADEIGYRLYTTSSTSHATDKSHIQEQLKHDYLYQPYQIQNLAGDKAMALTVINRQNQPPRIVYRPKKIEITIERYTPKAIEQDTSVFRT